MEGLNHILYAIIILVNDFVLRVMELEPAMQAQEELLPEDPTQSRK